jgi:biotin carboxyl carrier protein
VDDRVQVRSEWPGRVAEIHVDEGQRVSAGDALVTLESMKMLTEIEAPVSGVVRRIAVALDAAVDEGVLLLEIELVA